MRNSAVADFPPSLIGDPSNRNFLPSSVVSFSLVELVTSVLANRRLLIALFACICATRKTFSPSIFLSTRTCVPLPARARRRLGSNGFPRGRITWLSKPEACADYWPYALCFCG